MKRGMSVIAMNLVVFLSQLSHAEELRSNNVEILVENEAIPHAPSRRGGAVSSPRTGSRSSGGSPSSGRINNSNNRRGASIGMGPRSGGTWAGRSNNYDDDGTPVGGWRRHDGRSWSSWNTGWNGCPDRTWGNRHTYGSYWKNTSYDTCYSNYYSVAVYAKRIYTFANTLTNRDDISSNLLSSAEHLSNSAKELYELLSSCQSDQAEYQTLLDSFDSLSRDYHALVDEIRDSDSDVDASSIYNSFNNLASGLR